MIIPDMVKNIYKYSGRPRSSSNNASKPHRARLSGHHFAYLHTSRAKPSECGCVCVYVSDKLY